MDIEYYPEIKEIAEYLKHMKFRSRFFGGCDQESVLYHMQEITNKYKNFIENLLSKLTKTENNEKELSFEISLLREKKLDDAKQIAVLQEKLDAAILAETENSRRHEGFDQTLLEIRELQETLNRQAQTQAQTLETILEMRSTQETTNEKVDGQAKSLNVLLELRDMQHAATIKAQEQSKAFEEALKLKLDELEATLKDYFEQQKKLMAEQDKAPNQTPYQQQYVPYAPPYVPPYPQFMSYAHGNPGLHSQPQYEVPTPTHKPFVEVNSELFNNGAQIPRRSERHVSYPKDWDQGESGMPYNQFRGSLETMLSDIEKVEERIKQGYAEMASPDKEKQKRTPQYYERL